MAEDFIKKQPFSLEAEQSVLGSVLIDPELFKEVATVLTADDFYLSNHREIYSAMKDLFLAQDRRIDVVTVIDMLVQRGIYTDQESRNYIKTVCDTVPSSSNIKDYANIVKNKSILRKLIEASGDISDAAYSERDSVTAILDMAEQKIYDIAEVNQRSGLVHIKDVIAGTFQYLQLLSTNSAEVSGTKTGFGSLDNVLVGLGKGDLVLVGARPGMGKTSFCLNVATNVAKASPKAVCVFSLEMSAEQMALRMLSSEALVQSVNLRSGNIRDDWDKLGVAASTLSQTNIYLDESANITVTEMKAKLRRMKNLGLVVIDYLQLMHSDIRTDNRVQEVAEISRGLKIMAKELNVPVICCSQLSRATEGRKDKIPSLSDLRESGSIEQDADIVLFLFRPDYYDQDQQHQNRAQVIVAKNRHGSTETVEMAWDGQYTRFYSIETNLSEGG